MKWLNRFSILRQSPTVKIQLSANKDQPGSLAKFFGGNIQTVGFKDRDGNRIDQSYLSHIYRNTYFNFIRKPNGTETYKIKSADDADTMTLINDVFPTLRDSVKHDITFPPQLPIQEIRKWETSRLNRIALFNEVPMHTGPNKPFPTPADAVQQQILYYQEIPSEHRNKVFIHTGKPEVIRYKLVADRGIQIHQELLNLTSNAVRLAKLPARIATTHKLEKYSNDQLDFYRELISDYRWYFGPQVEILFHEYKLKGAESQTFEELLRLAEFWLIMARLNHESPYTFAGGSFQVLAGPGSNNLFHIASREDGTWRTGATLKLWEMFTDIIVNGRYCETTIQNRPEHLQLEVFENNGKYHVLFANDGPEIELRLPASQIRYFQDDIIITPDIFKNKIPANAVGVIIQ